MLNGLAESSECSQLANQRVNLSKESLADEEALLFALGIGNRFASGENRSPRILFQSHIVFLEDGRNLSIVWKSIAIK